MKSVLCTLFSFNYMDKGLALYESLERVAGNFVLYVLAMDDDCYAYLIDCGYAHMVPIRLSDFENEELLAAKQNRSFGEYCWTCSSPLIEYVLDYYREPACAYIDADMYFYADPAILFRELEQRCASVLLTGHRFGWFERPRAEVLGRFCVEFNLFVNNAQAKDLLGMWKRQCLENCSSDAVNGSFGDQKYLDNWVDEYAYVIETEHLGAGVAPWNISQYKLVSRTDAGFRLKCRGQVIDLVFYHFAGLKYLNRETVDMNIYDYWGIDDRFVIPLYREYLQTVDSMKEAIFQKTGRLILLQAHPAFANQKPSRRRIRSILTKMGKRSGRMQLLFKDLPKELLKSKNILYWKDV